MRNENTNNQDKEIRELTDMIVASYLKNNMNFGDDYCLCFNDSGLADQIAHALRDTNAVEFLPAHERMMIIMEVLINLTGLSNGKSLFPRQLSFDQVLIASIIKEITLSVFWSKGGHQTLTHLVVLHDEKLISSLGPITLSSGGEISNDAEQLISDQQNSAFSVRKVVKSLISLGRRK